MFYPLKQVTVSITSAVELATGESFYNDADVNVR